MASRCSSELNTDGLGLGFRCTAVQRFSMHGKRVYSIDRSKDEHHTNYSQKSAHRRGHRSEWSAVTFTDFDISRGHCSGYARWRNSAFEDTAGCASEHEAREEGCDYRAFGSHGDRSSSRRMMLESCYFSIKKFTGGIFGSHRRACSWLLLRAMSRHRMTLGRRVCVASVVGRTWQKNR